MKEIDINEIINLNIRLLLLLGIGTSIIANQQYSSSIDRDWWLLAIDEVIYKKNPIPPFPK
jgi:hypothetical protein